MINGVKLKNFKGVCLEYIGVTNNISISSDLTYSLVNS